VAAGFTVVRALNLLFLVLCGGGALALVAVLGDVDGTVRRRLTGALGVAGGALAILAALGLPFQAAEVGGTGLGGGFAAAALAAVRSQRFGEIWLLRAWLAVAFAVVALGLRFARARRHRPGELALLAVGAALLLTAPLAGHAEVEGTLATIADSAHVLAAAAWGGGLVALAGALALAPAAARWPLAARAVPRFSLLATVAVGVLLLAGAGNAIIEVSAWRGLWQSTYGELVLAKIALALPLLGLGAFNHRVLVPQLRDGGLPPERRRVFLRAIAIELAILAGVIAVTGVLIGQAPARNEVALTSRTSAAHRAGPFIATITVTPAVVGSGEVAIALRGVHAHPPTVGEVDLATRAPGGRRVATPAVDRGGPLRFAARSVTFARAGVWQFVLTVRTGLTEFVARVPIRIGADP